MWSYNTGFGATKDFDDNDNPIQFQTANGQYLGNKKEVSAATLRPGDLLFFNYEHGIDPKTGLPKMADHVAMYVEKAAIAHLFLILSPRSDRAGRA